MRRNKSLKKLIARILCLSVILIGSILIQQLCRLRSNPQTAQKIDSLQHCDAVIAIGDIQFQTKYKWVDDLTRFLGINANVDSAVSSTEGQLKALGYNVLVDRQATGSRIFSYLSNNQIKAFIFIGHNIGDHGVQALVAADGSFVGPEQFSAFETHTPSSSLEILVIAGCGSANADISGLTWANAFDPRGGRKMWFKGYKNPMQPVRTIIADIESGRNLPSSPVGRLEFSNLCESLKPTSSDHE